MTENTPKNHGFSEDSLFSYTIQQKWEKVVDIYAKYPESHKTKLKVFGATALHFFISECYDFKLLKRSYKQIKQMIDCIEESGSLFEVLSMQDNGGDTILHIAAFVGWDTICKYIASKNRQLISLRNAAGETPLFTAAYYSNMRAFLCLHEIYSKEGKADESVCRRNNGDTVLHVAISEEFFRLAYQIISYYPKLTHSVNNTGESPLHVLAKKPHLFKSRSRLGFFDSLIYLCVPVAKLKEEKYNRRATQNGCFPSSESSLPENHRTCAKIFLLSNPVFKSTSDEESNDDDIVPPNYTSLCLPKFSRLILSVLGRGYIQSIKEKQRHASQIMSKMVKSASGYRYDTNPMPPDPEPLPETRVEVPDISITPEENDALLTMSLIGSTAKSTTETQLETNESGEDENKSGASHPRIVLPPLLVAAKTGISEMVEEIIKKFPEAIFECVDNDGKNVLLLAVENRQIAVLDSVVATYSPKIFHKLDKKGNSALHLAAMLGKDMHPWGTSRVPLQMAWEIKWYKYVEECAPSLVQYNKEGKSPGNIFTETHAALVQKGSEWLNKTSESCLVAAVLIASVTFTTITSVPGGLHDQTGHPILENYTAFGVFSVAALFALCLSVTALVVFVTINISRCEEGEYESELPRKLLIGYTCISGSVVAMLVAFLAGHTLILTESRLRDAAVPIYAVAIFPVTYFVIAQLPLYFEILCAACVRKPLLRYRVMHNYS